VNSVAWEDSTSAAPQLALDFSSPDPQQAAERSLPAAVGRAPQSSTLSTTSKPVAGGARNAGRAETAGALPPSTASAAPRFIRFRDAPRFFGMDKNRFNRDIRPHLTEIQIGRQGRAFDRLEMEAAAEDYKSRNGIPVAHLNRRKPAWEIKKRQASPSGVGSGMSTSCSEERDFARALERAICGKPKGTSPSG
jgi:hypothetical protein